MSIMSFIYYVPSMLLVNETLLTCPIALCKLLTVYLNKFYDELVVQVALTGIFNNSNRISVINYPPNNTVVISITSINHPPKIQIFNIV